MEFNKTTLPYVGLGGAGGLLAGALSVHYFYRNLIRGLKENQRKEEIALRKHLEEKYRPFIDEAKKARTDAEFAQNRYDKLSASVGVSVDDEIAEALLKGDGTVLDIREDAFVPPAVDENSTEYKRSIIKTEESLEKMNALDLASYEVSAEGELTEAEYIAYPENDGPYFVSEKQAIECDFELENLTYYKYDDTLADEENEVYLEIDEVIGKENLDFLIDGTRLPVRTCYIRNDKYSTVYRLTLEGNSYNVVALGMTPTEDETADAFEARRKLKGA